MKRETREVWCRREGTGVRQQERKKGSMGQEERGQEGVGAGGKKEEGVEQEEMAEGDGARES